MRTNRIKTIIGAHSRRAKNRPQSLQTLERDLHMLPDLDERDHTFTQKLDHLLEQASVTIDAWLQSASSGATAQSAQTINWLGTDGSPTRIQRMVITGQDGHAYDLNTKDDTVRITSGTVEQHFSDAPNVFETTSVARY